MILILNLKSILQNLDLMEMFLCQKHLWWFSLTVSLTMSAEITSKGTLHRMILILNLKKSMNCWRKIVKEKTTEQNEVQMPVLTEGITEEGEEGIKEGIEAEMGIARTLGI